jgi:energy-coupling factor transport system permease protein
MDWLRQLPIGQYVDGQRGWLRRLDARLKLGWTLAFLATPVLAGPQWRLSLVALLVPVGVVASASAMRSPRELLLAPPPAGGPAPQRQGLPWEVLRWGPIQLGPLPIGPLVVNRRSAQLGLNSATLLFTLLHSANLLLLSTPPEELVWALSWVITPLGALGLPVERLGFTLLLSLRFLPLVQEEFQNLLRSIATRAVNLKSLGWKSGLGLLLSVAERLLANLLLRSEQGAEALMARGGQWVPPAQMRLARRAARWLNLVAAGTLVVFLGLRWQYGAL